jgi:hypothetical protein
VVPFFETVPVAIAGSDVNRHDRRGTLRADSDPRSVETPSSDEFFAPERRYFSVRMNFKANSSSLINRTYDRDGKSFTSTRRAHVSKGLSAFWV